VAGVGLSRSASTPCARNTEERACNLPKGKFIGSDLIYFLFSPCCSSWFLDPNAGGGEGLSCNKLGC